MTANLCLPQNAHFPPTTHPVLLAGKFGVTMKPSRESPEPSSGRSSPAFLSKTTVFGSDARTEVSEPLLSCVCFWRGGGRAYQRVLSWALHITMLQEAHGAGLRPILLVVRDLGCARGNGCSASSMTPW